ncbi:MAG: efflux RND transporter periplasmic adaptor subunit [Acidobacteriaceae bacterium]
MNARNKVFTLFGIILIASASYYFLTTNHSSDYVIIGTVDANQVVVSPMIAGRLEKLNVEDGTAVKAGEVIAVLNPDELRAQEQASEATLAGAEHRVGETSASLKLARGQTSSTVKQAEAQVANAEAQLQAAQANVTRSQQSYDRIFPLMKAGVASKQDADNAASDLSLQRANGAAAAKAVDAAQANLLVARAGTNQANAAERIVDESRSQAANAKFQLSAIATQLGYTTVNAPVDGVVTTRVARQGEVVNAGSPIVVVVDLNDTWVYADAPETMAVDIALGDTFKVRLPNGEMTTGKVTYKAAEADFATQRDVGKTKRDIKAIALKLAIDNHEHKFAPGMTAEVLVPKKMQGAAQ